MFSVLGELGEIISVTNDVACVAHASFHPCILVAFRTLQWRFTSRSPDAVVEVTPRVPSPRAMDTHRSTPHNTLGRIYGVIAEFVQPRQLDLKAVIGLGPSKMSALIAELCNKYELRQLVDYEALATTYRAGSEGYPTTSTRAGATVAGRSRS